LSITCDQKMTFWERNLDENNESIKGKGLTRVSRAMKVGPKKVRGLVDVTTTRGDFE